MCSYCGCRNIPMIAKLNAEHDAIVNSSYALEIAFRDQDLEAARLACKELGDLLHPHTHREQVGLFAEMEKDELFTEHVASLCAEHDELDADLDAIAAGDLPRIQTMITLLNNPHRPRGERAAPCGAGLPGRHPVGHHPTTRTDERARARTHPVPPTLTRSPTFRPKMTR